MSLRLAGQQVFFCSFVCLQEGGMLKIVYGVCLVLMLKFH